MRDTLTLRGQTGNIGFVWIPDTTSTTGGGKTGLTNASAGLLISARRELSATMTAYSGANIGSITTLGTWANPGTGKINIKEVDATNAPGLYELHFENANYSSSDASRKLVGMVQVTGGAPTPFEVPLSAVDPQSATAFVTGINSLAPPTNWNLMVIDANGRVDLSKLLGGTIPTPNVTGVPLVDVADVLGIGVSADASGNLIVVSNVITTGIAQGGGANTITLAGSASSVSTRFQGCIIDLVSLTGFGQTRKITSYTTGGTNRLVTVDRAWDTQPDNTTKYTIRRADSVLVDANNAAIAGTLAAQAQTDALNALTGGTNTIVVNASHQVDASRVTGTVGAALSVTGAVGSVSGTVGQALSVAGTVGAALSVTGAVGSVSGTVGQALSVAGAVGSVSGTVGQALSVAGTVGAALSVTGAVGSVSGTVGQALSVAGTVGAALSVTGAVGSVAGTVGAAASVTGNVGGSVVGSVGSLAAQAQTDVKSALTSQGFTTGRATNIDNLDALVSSRLASGSYTVPPSAATIANAVLDAPGSNHVVASSIGYLIAQGTNTSGGGGGGVAFTDLLNGTYNAGTFGDMCKRLSGRLGGWR